jgi:predicted ATPase
MEYIQSFTYSGLWNKYNVCWNDINKDVNILVGINGKGKTTLLNAINDYYNANKAGKSIAKQIEATPLDSPVVYITSADVPVNVKKKANSPLYENLMRVVLQNEKQDSFFNYRMRALNYPDEAKRISERIDILFHEIDSYFAQTGKNISIHKDRNVLVFNELSGHTIELEMLSAGEKQLLYILLTVFLMDEKPAVLLMDEPELSLHIEWQEKLVKSIRKLNPSCLVILTTHSPSIFVSGWESKLVYIEDLFSPITK